MVKNHNSKHKSTDQKKKYNMSPKTGTVISDNTD